MIIDKFLLDMLPPNLREFINKTLNSAVEDVKNGKFGLSPLNAALSVTQGTKEALNKDKEDKKNSNSNNIDSDTKPPEEDQLKNEIEKI